MDHAQQPPTGPGRHPPAAAAAAPAASARTRSSPPRQHQPPHAASELRFAQRTLRKLVQDSTFFPVRDLNNRVRTLAESELDVGSLIGRGGFCEVRRASLRSAPGRPYALKYLSPTKTTASRVFQRGIADLAMEACFLSLLQHENIIGLHCVAEGSLEECYDCAPASGGAADTAGDEIVVDADGQLRLRRQPPPRPAAPSHFYGYFLLLDPLHGTLSDRIEHVYIPQASFDAGSSSAAMISSSSSSSSFQLWDRIRHSNLQDPSDPKVQLAGRLQILKGVASALRYLHEDCRLIFRDVKPDNIGFYRRYLPNCTCGYRSQMQYPNNAALGGRIPDECLCYEEITKLFDFGLAKELKQKYRQAHPSYPDQDTYKLTSCTGSRRYMAPEVCFAEPYNPKADVYSFGVLLYQAASLVTPFDGYSMGRHEREVLRGGSRPDVTIPNSASSSGAVLGRKRSASMDMEAPPKPGGGRTDDTEAKNQQLAHRTKQHWPTGLPQLMEECWDGDMRRRPDMLRVHQQLGSCIDALLGRQESSGVAAMRGGDASWDGAVMGGMAGDATAARWPELRVFQSHTTTSTDATTLAAKEEHNVSNETMGTDPMSSSGSFMHSSGLIGRDGVHLPFEAQQQQQFAFASQQRHRQHLQAPPLQHPTFNSSYPQSQPVAVPNMAAETGMRKDEGYEADTSHPNFNDSAVCRQQRRRSAGNNMEDSDPSAMALQ
ncbi:hypothetical protein ACHAXT_001726 [Thalassiosira profunda]